MTAVLFGLSGMAVGAAQAGLLGRQAGRASGALSFPLRFLLVAAVLTIAASAGHVFSGAGGWLLGFALASIVVYRRLG